MGVFRAQFELKQDEAQRRHLLSLILLP